MNPDKAIDILENLHDSVSSLSEKGKEAIRLGIAALRLKPRYAIAFIYSEMPQYDRMEFDGDAYHFYRGDVEVCWVSVATGQFTPQMHLEVFVTEANDEKDALAQLLGQHPYQIVSAIARRI